MRPGIRKAGLEALSVPLVERYSQSVVVAEAGVVDLVDAAVTRIGTRCAIGRRGEGAGDGARRVEVGVSDRRAQRSDVEVAHAVEADAAAPQVGHVQAEAACQLTLNSDVALVRVRIAQVLVGEENVHRSGRRSEGCRRQEIRINGAGGELRRSARVVGDRLLVDVIIQEQRVDQARLDAGEKDAVAGAEDGLAAGADGVRKAGARREIVLGRVDPARLRVVRIDDRRLRDPGVVVADADVEDQVGRDAVLILRIQPRVFIVVSTVGLPNRCEYVFQFFAPVVLPLKSRAKALRVA